MGDYIMLMGVSSILGWRTQEEICSQRWGQAEKYHDSLQLAGGSTQRIALGISLPMAQSRSYKCKHSGRR